MRREGERGAKLTEEEEIQQLLQRIDVETPAAGSQLISKEAVPFASMPISSKTLQGLGEAGLQFATEIQAAAIPHALAGRDILGAAKTGSGKTLAFLIPLLEKLFRERWTAQEGLGAIVLSPTRELSLQIFDVMRSIGRRHCFSAALITGGRKEFVQEQQRIPGMNILVATPGRLLQHLEQTAAFDTQQLQLLVLDEADRVLDLGFQVQLDAILSYLPPRQTLLFSATQTKSVKALARLSLSTPEFIAVHAEDVEATPRTLVQNYSRCLLSQKLDILFGFLKSHVKSKIIVFFATCAQVRFVYELFCGLQPGLPVAALHGKIKQARRQLIYSDFLQRSAACLFATDIAARGLDFPAVDWVLQVDAPEDVAMYIHRVGRTARYTNTGRALMLVMEEEEERLIPALRSAGVPLQRLTVNPQRMISVSARAAALVAANVDHKTLAKKAFASYLRSLQLLPQCPINDVSVLHVDDFAQSMGLPFTPELPAPVVDVKKAREENRDKKNVNRALDKLKKQIHEAKAERKRQRELEKQSKRGSHAEEAAKSGAKVSGASERSGAAEEDELFTVKQHSVTAEENGAESGEAMVLADEKQSDKLKKKLQKIGRDGLSKAAAASAKKLLFDDAGRSQPALALMAPDAQISVERMETYAKQVKGELEQTREEDWERERQRLRELRLKRKRAQQDAEEEAAGAAAFASVRLGSYQEDENEQEEGNDGDDSASKEVSSGDEMSDEDEDRIDQYQKRRRTSLSDDAEDADSEDKFEVTHGGDVHAQEELALRLLAARRR